MGKDFLGFQWSVLKLSRELSHQKDSLSIKRNSSNLNSPHLYTIAFESNVGHLLLGWYRTLRLKRRRKDFRLVLDPSVVLQKVGCDGRLNSQATVDLCGVCGGDNQQCQVASGDFKAYLTRKSNSHLFMI